MSGVFRVVKGRGKREFGIAYDATDAALRSQPMRGQLAAVAVAAIGAVTPGMAQAITNTTTYCVSEAGTPGANGSYLNGVNQADSQYTLTKAADHWVIKDGNSFVYAEQFTGSSEPPSGNSWVTSYDCLSLGLGNVVCVGDLPMPTVIAGDCDDNDGVAAGTENSVPSASGSGSGDGNGDSTPDSEQANVSSLPSAVGNVFVTLAAADGVSFSGITTSVPSNLPAGASAPYGAVSFTATGVGNSAAFALLVPFNPDITGALKFNRFTSLWDTIGTVTQVGTVKTKISYTLINGGPYDQDGIAGDDKIEDPVAPFIARSGATATPVPTLSEWGALSLSGLMGVFGIWAYRRRTRSESSTAQT